MLDIQRILQTLGFAALTPMQQQMGEQTRRSEGVVLLSPTGSGKTLAYLLPLVERIRPEMDALQAVVIVPTRELAAQSEDVLRRMKVDVRSMALYGGRPTMEEHRRLREVKPHIVFATPGRLCDHLDKENLNARGVRLLVVDEFDKCLELGFQEEMEHALVALPALRSCWLTSATDAEAIPAFMQRASMKFVRLDFLHEQTEGRVESYAVPSPEKDKLATLARLLTHIAGRPAIVFVSHRESVERVAGYLRTEGFGYAAYHGGMEQDVRERALYKFRSGAANVLVSTDLAARGLDIPEVRAVVHYHLPLRAEDLTHRNGRTARWDADGAVYYIQGPEETLPEFVGEPSVLTLDPSVAVRPVRPEFATLYIGRGKRDKLSKGDVLGFLCKKGGLRSADIGRIDVGAHQAYVAVRRGKVKGLLAAIGGEKIKGMKTIIEEMRH